MRRKDHLRPSTLGAALALALCGCYSYAALPPQGARVGEHVRVRVSGAEAERLEPVLGANDRRVEGELLEQADTEIALGIALPTAAEATPLAQRPQQRVVIPRSDLQEMQLLRLDKFRTSLLVGGVAAIAVAVAVGKGSSLIGSGGSGGSANENRVPRATPLLKWSVALP